MYGNTGEIAFAQNLVEFSSPRSTLYKDDDLIELKRVKKVVQFSVLLTLLKLDVKLLQTVECEFSLVINVNFQRVLHEFLADRSDFLGQGGAEHHDLFLSWGSTEDLLYVPPHI